MIHSITLERLHQSEITNLEFEQDERMLVAECIKKNKAAQKIVYETNYPQLLGICLRYLSNPAEAEDILHDSFILIFNKLDQFNFNSKLSTWMSRIAINGCLAHLKRQKLLQIDYALPIEEINQAEISEEELYEFSVNEILKLLNQLPIGYKTVLSLYSIDGMSHKEIGEVLSITESSSRSQLTRARKYLRDLLNNSQNHG